MHHWHFLRSIEGGEVMFWDSKITEGSLVDLGLAKGGVFGLLYDYGAGHEVE